MVAPGGEALGGVVSCFQHMVHTEGFFSLYKGLWPAVISMAPSGAVFYGVYDILKTTYLQSPEGQKDLRKRIEMERKRRRIGGSLQNIITSEESHEIKALTELKEEAENLGQLELGPIRTLVYGAIAGICAETSTYPFEVIRRQMQMQTAATKMGAFATCQSILQRGGIGALYSGLLPSALQVVN
jgi:solute carrier family 25 phosphate transporter 23/24/25/41